MQNVDRLAWVFQKLADHRQSLALLMRYEGALNRSYDRAFKQLHMLQSARLRAQPNEPKPAQAAPHAEPGAESGVEPVQNPMQPNEPKAGPRARAQREATHESGFTQRITRAW